MSPLAALRAWTGSHPRMAALLMMGLVVGAVGVAATTRAPGARTAIFLLVAAVYAFLQAFLPRRGGRRRGRPPHDLGDT